LCWSGDADIAVVFEVLETVTARDGRTAVIELLG
jgi:hypothetical protein